jgi:Domain of unknown function (DUF1844)
LDRGAALDNDKPFVVKDRRHFTTEGEPRQEDAPAEAAEAPSPPSPEAVRPRAAGPQPKADFASFVISVATQATFLLDGRGLPEGASPEEGLAGAQSIISILEMLQDKTEGRRSPEETELLENLLYELRMAYVAQTRVRGA